MLGLVPETEARDMQEGIFGFRPLEVRGTNFLSNPRATLGNISGRFGERRLSAQSTLARMTYTKSHWDVPAVQKGTSQRAVQS